MEQRSKELRLLFHLVVVQTFCREWIVKFLYLLQQPNEITLMDCGQEIGCIPNEEARQ